MFRVMIRVLPFLITNVVSLRLAAEKDSADSSAPAPVSLPPVPHHIKQLSEHDGRFDSELLEVHRKASEATGDPVDHKDHNRPFISPPVVEQFGLAMKTVIPGSPLAPIEEPGTPKPTLRTLTPESTRVSSIKSASQAEQSDSSEEGSSSGSSSDSDSSSDSSDSSSDGSASGSDIENTSGRQNAGKSIFFGQGSDSSSSEEDESSPIPIAHDAEGEHGDLGFDFVSNHDDGDEIDFLGDEVDSSFGDESFDSSFGDERESPVPVPEGELSFEFAQGLTADVLNMKQPDTGCDPDDEPFEINEDGYFGGCVPKGTTFEDAMNEKGWAMVGKPFVNLELDELVSVVQRYSQGGTGLTRAVKFVPFIEENKLMIRIPTTLEDAERVANEHGLQLGGADAGESPFAGKYPTKGLHAYNQDAPAHLRGRAFFGTGGTIEEMQAPVAEPMYRPESKDDVDADIKEERRGYELTKNIASKNVAGYFGEVKTDFTYLYRFPHRTQPNQRDFTYEKESLKRKLGKFETKRGVLFVMEDINGGDFKDFLNKKYPTSAITGQDKENLVRYAKHIATGVRKMHGQNVAYNDVGAKNVMLNNKGTEPTYAVLIDFGFVARTDENGFLAEAKPTGSKSTGSDSDDEAPYMTGYNWHHYDWSPELYLQTTDADIDHDAQGLKLSSLKERRINLKKVDLWALGVLFFQMFTGQDLLPTVLESERVIQGFVSKEGFERKFVSRKDGDSQANSETGQCAVQRADIRQMLTSSWVTDATVKTIVENELAKLWRPEEVEKLWAIMEPLLRLNPEERFPVKPVAFKNALFPFEMSVAARNFASNVAQVGTERVAANQEAVAKKVEAEAEAARKKASAVKSAKKAKKQRKGKDETASGNDLENTPPKIVPQKKSGDRPATRSGYRSPRGKNVLSSRIYNALDEFNTEVRILQGLAA